MALHGELLVEPLREREPGQSEVHALGLAQRDRHVFHEVRLKEAKINHPVSDILSEGERRVVSLAAFLADVEGVDSSTPIIFDDPITSLDQDFEESVVARLVALAAKRQVIVFTHRLSMLTMLEDSAKAGDLAVRTVALTREDWGTGQPGDTPFSTRKPDQVINGLKDRLTRATKILKESGTAEYEIHAKAICSEFRILVERIVEDTLLNNVIRRFRRSVQTYGRIAGLAKITAADCNMVDDLMTKYSRFEHSQPSEAPILVLEPDEIGSDLIRLQTWLKEFSGRKVPVFASAP